MCTINNSWADTGTGKDTTSMIVRTKFRASYRFYWQLFNCKSSRDCIVWVTPRSSLWQAHNCIMWRRHYAAFALLRMIVKKTRHNREKHAKFLHVRQIDKLSLQVHFPSTSTHFARNSTTSWSICTEELAWRGHCATLTTVIATASTRGLISPHHDVSYTFQQAHRRSYNFLW